MYRLYYNDEQEWYIVKPSGGVYWFEPGDINKTKNNLVYLNRLPEGACAPSMYEFKFIYPKEVLREIFCSAELEEVLNHMYLDMMLEV